MGRYWICRCLDQTHPIATQQNDGWRPLVLSLYTLIVNPCVVILLHETDMLPYAGESENVRNDAITAGGDRNFLRNLTCTSLYEFALTDMLSVYAAWMRSFTAIIFVFNDLILILVQI